MKLVFISGFMHPGDLGDINGLAYSCKEDAAGAHLPPMSFDVWLAGSSGSPSTRMNRSTGDYVLVDGTVVAHGWNQLAAGPLLHPIDLEASGQASALTWTPSCPLVWRNTAPDGTELASAPSCNDWTTLAATGTLDGGCTAPCATEASFYCVEQ